MERGEPVDKCNAYITLAKETRCPKADGGWCDRCGYAYEPHISLRRYVCEKVRYHSHGHYKSGVSWANDDFGAVPNRTPQYSS